MPFLVKATKEQSGQSLIWEHDDTATKAEPFGVKTGSNWLKVSGAAQLLYNYPESLGANPCGPHKCLLPFSFCAYTLKYT